MQNKRFARFLGVIALLALLAAACTPVVEPAGDAPAVDAESDATTADAPAADLQIGLVTDVGRVNDRSFNQSAWEGVQQAAEDLGVAEEDIRFIETQSPTDYADNIQQFVDNGYSVIVTVGFGLGEATAAAAAENPDIYFIGVDQFQGEAVENVVGLVFNEDRSGFLAGALAANLTESGTIGAVLGTDSVPPVVAFNEGYIAGAQYINPDIEIVSTYHPGGLDVAFTDPEWGAATARQALDNGADIIFGAGGNTGNGALQEVAAEAESGATVYCIGVDSDQWETLEAAHPCLVSSAMKLISPGVVDLVTLYAGGEPATGNYFGGSGLAPFHDFEDVVPDEVKTQLEEIATGLDDGSIETGYNPGG